MSGAPQASNSMMHHPTKRSSSRDRRNLRLGKAIHDFQSRLVRLARLGRPGQWVLHHEDLYHTKIDTRPQSRNPNGEVPVRGLPLLQKNIIWAGKGPAPNFRDVAFWEAKCKHLDEKIEQIKGGLVQPRFTPEELQVLESLEQQPFHFFSVELDRQTNLMGDCKCCIFNVLFDLAKLGRPGQWILHNEDLYHPAIDTRPQSRVEGNVVIRDSTYKGDTRVLAENLFVDYELSWGGDGPRPDSANFFYWETKSKDLLKKLLEVEDGLVQHGFTPEELQVLESMEADKDHAFAILAREQKENPPVIQTAEEKAASSALWLARQMLVTVMDNLWNSGLAGKWVLHHQDFYISAYDTRFRERDEDDDQPSHIVVDSSMDLYFDCRYKYKPLPDLDSVVYWEDKKTELMKMRDDIKAGRLTTHNFSAGELMRIQLLERAILEQFEREDERLGDSSGADHRTKQVAAWLGDGTGVTHPAPQRMRTPTPPPSFSAPPGTPDNTGQQGHAPEKNDDAEDGQVPKPEAPKRKRLTHSQDEQLSEDSTRPAKRIKVQSRQEPTSTMPTAPQGSNQAVSSPTHKVQGKSRIKRKLNENRTKDVDTGRRRRTRGDLLATNAPLRRSARIAAQTSGTYR